MGEPRGTEEVGEKESAEMSRANSGGAEMGKGGEGVLPVRWSGVQRAPSSELRYFMCSVSEGRGLIVDGSGEAGSSVCLPRLPIITSIGNPCPPSTWSAAANGAESGWQRVAGYSWYSPSSSTGSHLPHLSFSARPRSWAWKSLSAVWTQ